MKMKTLFQAPSSSFDPSFWEELYNLKLNILKLDSNDVTIIGLMNLNVFSDKNHFNSLLHFSSSSLNDHHVHHHHQRLVTGGQYHQEGIIITTHRQHNNSVQIKGTLRDVNTIEVSFSH